MSSTKDTITKGFEGNPNRIVNAAHAIVLAYAGSANANPERIPKLFADLVELLITGENPKPGTAKAQGQTGY